MKRIIKIIIISLVAYFIVIIGYIFIIRINNKNKDYEEANIKTQECSENDIVENSIHTETEKVYAKTISISGLYAKRVNSKEIIVNWEDTNDYIVSSYIIEKYENTKNGNNHIWNQIGELSTRNHEKGQMYTFSDILTTSEPQQYVYRVIPKFYNEKEYVSADESGVVCSNIKICIDAGHEPGANAVPGTNSYGYVEGDFTLKLAEELKKILETDYGIEVCMTRDEGGFNTIGNQISMRGAYAAQQNSDLFVSIHTNANENNVNGAYTFSQPTTILKPIIIVNDLIISNKKLLDICNDIGAGLSRVSYDEGISSHNEFSTVSQGQIKEWTTSYNDSTEENGTVVCRHGKTGQYYGVLRGAEEAGVPGMIIEHGHHTVPEMRQAAMQGDLAKKWAQADAEGISSIFTK